jgi:hypothetical protein
MGSIDAQQPPPDRQAAAAAATPTPATPLTRDSFSGMWDYNAAESVNAANGRPEQAPQSATQRRGPGAPVRMPPQYPNGGGSFGGIGSGGVGGRSWGGMPRGPSVPALNTFVLRDLARDLLEVPEAYTITVADAAVTFVDDLGREYSFTTDGKKQKHQMGAAVFDARTSWQGLQLRKQISAAENFKMTETYFLSPDGQRLFVIIRVGEQRKDVPVVGVNRVYDRVKS